MPLRLAAVFLFTSGVTPEVNDVNKEGGGSVMTTLSVEMHRPTDVMPAGMLFDVSKIGAKLRAILGFCAHAATPPNPLQDVLAACSCR
jgi:hypothetical protein